jgi:hypothetical protein
MSSHVVLKSASGSRFFAKRRFIYDSISAAFGGSTDTENWINFSKIIAPDTRLFSGKFWKAHPDR